jgi:mannan endo-1,6-alpha-mannosidase
MGLLNRTTETFFTNGIMYEEPCESAGTCDNDQKSFKAYLSRWMASTAKIASFTADIILPLLKTSAAAAAAQCNGGTTGTTCGLVWTDNGTWDGTSGVGQQMAALEVISSTLITEAAVLVTNSTGGTSVGNSNAGSGSATTASDLTSTVTTTADKAGAGILTAVLICGLMAGIWFMIV